MRKQYAPCLHKGWLLSWLPALTFRRALPTLLLPSLSLITSVVPGVCRADKMTSPLTGWELPAGAQSVQDKDALAQGRALLAKLAQAGGKRIGRMEAYRWTQTEGVQAKGDVLFQHRADVYRKLPDIEKDGVKVASFVMAFKARKLACMGLWLQSGTELYLALGEALDPNAPAPMKEKDSAAPPNTGIVPPHLSGTPAFPQLTRKPGVVQGTVLDRNGKPMPDVTVSAWFSVPSIYLSTADLLKTTTDEHGHYAINVKEAVALGHVAATRRVQYNGQSCLLPFARLDASGHRRDSDIINRSEGDVVNFMPAISGLRESDRDPENWASYFGSMIQVENEVHNTGRSLFAGSQVRVVLTPKGPLLDGSAGRPLTRDTPVNSTYFHFDLKDVPIGS